MSKEFNIDKIQQQRNQDRTHFLSLKINLEQKMDSLIKWEQDFNFQLWMKDRAITEKKALHQFLFEEKDADTREMACSEVALWVRSIRPSYISPAYHYNKYIDTLVQDIYWDDIKNEIDESQWISSSMRETMVIMELHSCLMSIKMGLDRMFRLFSMYYKGFSSNTTFGHIVIREDGTEKAKNFMAYPSIYPS